MEESAREDDMMTVMILVLTNAFVSCGGFCGPKRLSKTKKYILFFVCKKNFLSALHVLRSQLRVHAVNSRFEKYIGGAGNLSSLSI